MPAARPPLEPLTLAVDAADRRIAWYAALALALHVLEAALPSPLPGLKPGLANVLVLIVLVRHGLAAAAFAAGLRVLVGSLLVGTFLSPAFLLSAGGALAALLVLALAHASRCFGPVGLSLLAAEAHMAMQFALARLLRLQSAAPSRPATKSSSSAWPPPVATPPSPNSSPKSSPAASSDRSSRTRNTTPSGASGRAR